MMPFHLITQNGKSVFSMWLTDSRDLFKKNGEYFENCRNVHDVTDIKS